MIKIKDMASYWDVTYKTAYERIKLIGKHVLSFESCEDIENIYQKSFGWKYSQDNNLFHFWNKKQNGQVFSFSVVFESQLKTINLINLMRAMQSLLTSIHKNRDTWTIINDVMVRAIHKDMVLEFIFKDKLHDLKKVFGALTAYRQGRLKDGN